MMPVDSSSGLTQESTTNTVAFSSSSQNISAYTTDSTGNLVEKGRHASPNMQRGLPRNLPFQQQVMQPCQHQQLRQQLLKQKAQHPGIQPSMQSNTTYSQMKQQHTSILPQKMQPALQNSILMKQKQVPQIQQNMATSFQQSLGLQSNVCGLLQQQHAFKPESDALKMQSNQHPQLLFQQSEATAQQQKYQQISQPMQLNQILGNQKQGHSFAEAIQQKFQTSSSLLYPQCFMSSDQLKPPSLSQRVFPNASSASVNTSTQIKHANLTDWHDHAYQQLLSLKDMYLLEALKLCRRAQELCLQPPNAEAAAKYEKTRVFVEKITKFLQMPRDDIVHCPKEKFYRHMEVVTWYFNQVRVKNPGFVQPSDQLQSTSQSRNLQPQQHIDELRLPCGQARNPQLLQKRNTNMQFNSLNPGSASLPFVGTQFLTRGLLNSQACMINSRQDGSSMGPETSNASNTCQYDLARSMQQYTPTRPQQTGISSSLHGGVQAELDQGVLIPSQISSVRASNQNTISISQKMNPFKQEIINILDSNMTCLLSNSANIQMTQTQKMKQSIQQQLIEQNKDHLLMQKISEVNDSKMGKFMGFSSKILQQNIGQQMEYFPQSMLPSTYRQLHAVSPQGSQHSSPQMDLRSLLSSLSKAVTPLHSSASTSIVPSPSTPLTPSSAQVDIDKHSSGVCSSPNAENIEHPQTPLPPSHLQAQLTRKNQIFAVDRPGLSSSPLPTEITSAAGSQPLHAPGASLARLLQAVKSISPEALKLSVLEIGSVVDITDMIAGAKPCGESSNVIGEDLGDDIRCCFRTGSFYSQCEDASAQRTKRRLSVTSLDTFSASISVSNSVEEMDYQRSDMDLTTASRVKRPKIEPYNKLLQEEINEIKMQLVETMLYVGLHPSENAVEAEPGEGTIISCSYNAVGLSKTFNLQCASSRTLSSLFVQFLVPKDYPASSPIVLNMPPVDFSKDCKEIEDLSSKAKSRLNASLCKLSQPLSLKEMVKTWDACAREVLLEFLQPFGGECFSSRYGIWESCITA